MQNGSLQGRALAKYVLNISNLHAHKSDCRWAERLTSRHGKKEGDSIWEFKWDWDRPRKKVSLCQKCFTFAERNDIARTPDAERPRYEKPYEPHKWKR